MDSGLDLLSQNKSALYGSQRFNNTKQQLAYGWLQNVINKYDMEIVHSNGNEEFWAAWKYKTPWA